MGLHSSTTSWGAAAKVLHWLMAIVILVDTYIVWFIVNQDFENFRDQSTQMFRLLMPWHKALGFIALALLILRLVWRQIDTRPAYPATMTPWQRTASSLAQNGLYGLIAVSILTGWARVSSNGSPANVFNWFTLPAIVPKDEALHAWTEILHDWSSWAIIAIAAIHAAAALKHHFIDRDNVLRSMLPFMR